MHVVQTAAAPPNQGRMYLPSKSCTQKRRKALRKIVIPNGCLRGCRLTAADCGQRRSCQNANSLHDVLSADLGNVKGLGAGQGFQCPSRKSIPFLCWKACQRFSVWKSCWLNVGRS